MWDGPTLMRGSSFNHFAQPEESVKSGTASGLMLGGSKLDMSSVQSSSQRIRKRAAIGSRAPRDVRARGLGPDRTGEMAVALMARNHVPVQMGRDVAEARKVDFVRIEERAEHGLSSEDRIHEPCALGRLKVGHLLHVPLEDHPAKAGIIRIVDQHNAAEPVTPEQIPAGEIA